VSASSSFKIVESARTFYYSCPELHGETVSWQSFKPIFRERFKDIRTDQFHYMQLQTARQRRNEGPQEFADRCRALAQKFGCKVVDPQVQRVHQENAERMLLAAFVSGLVGVPGRQCRFSNPQNIQQALSIALTVDQAEKQERFNECFIPNTIKQSGYFRGHPVIAIGERKIQVARKIRTRISLITELRAALAIFLGVGKLSPHSAVMNARESDILAENVPRN